MASLGETRGVHQEKKILLEQVVFTLMQAGVNDQL